MKNNRTGASSFFFYRDQRMKTKGTSEAKITISETLGANLKHQSYKQNEVK